MYRKLDLLHYEYETQSLHNEILMYSYICIRSLQNEGVKQWKLYFCYLPLAHRVQKFSCKFYMWIASLHVHKTYMQSMNI